MNGFQAAFNYSKYTSSLKKVTLTLPKTGNQNHKNTVFGGSMALAATTCGWALVHLNLSEVNGNIVIQQGQTRYLCPALSDLILWTESPSANEWEIARENWQQTGKGKITLQTEIYSQGELVAVFSGRYVGLSDN